MLDTKVIYNWFESTRDQPVEIDGIVYTPLEDGPAGSSGSVSARRVEFAVDVELFRAVRVYCVYAVLCVSCVTQLNTARGSGNRRSVLNKQLTYQIQII